MERKIVLDWIDDNASLIEEVADKIWEYAEVALREFKSSRLIADVLRKGDFKIEVEVAGLPTAFTATYGSQKPVIGILGEYDALPGLSQKSQPTREPIVEGGSGHGCGHNLLGAASMGAALAVKDAMERKDVKGTVKFFGCPAEETLVGKVFMAREGVFDGLDAALCWHPGMSNTAWMSSTLAINSAKFNFYGVSSHAGAAPEMGRSALDATELMNIGVNYLREHVIDKARIHYVITKGGEAPNVVPPEAQVWYYMRAPKRSQVEEIYGRVQRIAKGACLMTDTEMDVDFIVGAYDTLPNKTLSYILLDNMKQIGAPEWTREEMDFAEKLSKSVTTDQKRTVLEGMHVPSIEEKIVKVLDDAVEDPLDEGEISTGSTDVGDVSHIVPTAQIIAAVTVLGVPFHSWQMTATSGMSIGHKGGVLAAKALALTAIDLLTNPEKLGKVKDEFQVSTRDLKYVSPLPPGLKPPIG